MKRTDASGRVDPSHIGVDQFEPRSLSKNLPINTLLPFLLVFNADTIAHTLTLTIRQAGSAAQTVAVTISNGSCLTFPTLIFAAISCDTAGTPASVLAVYSDVAPSGFRPAAGSGFASSADIDGLDFTNNTSTELMAGFGSGGSPTVFTPKSTGIVLVIWTGFLFGSSAGIANITVLVRPYFGTGSAPASGAAVTGTAAQSSIQGEIAATAATETQLDAPFCCAFVRSGLTVGTAYWFDLSERVTSGSAGQLVNVHFCALEVVS